MIVIPSPAFILYSNNFNKKTAIHRSVNFLLKKYAHAKVILYSFADGKLTYRPNFSSSGRKGLTSVAYCGKHFIPTLLL